MTERARSTWAWGWEDRRPAGVVLEELSRSAGLLLGTALSELPVSPRRMPESRLTVPAELAGFSSAADRDRAGHTFGKGYPDLVFAFRGDFSAAPDFVCSPRTEAEIEAVLEWCAAHRVACVPYGGGTSVVGGVEARVPPGYNGAISLDMGAFCRVREVDVVSRVAWIEAGILGPALERQLASHGLTLRHFPQSFEFSTLGGWLATRSGGHFATLYTHIDDLTQSIRLVTPAGRWESRRVPASGAGPNPDRLALGSEGILGVITSAWMRVRPRPRYRGQASVHFERFTDAVDAARSVAQSGLHPSNARVLDPQEAMINRVTGDGTAVLLLAFESADHSLRPSLERALALSAAHGGVCPKGPRYRESGEEEAADAAASWKAAFLDAPYLQSALVGLGVLVDTFETACTWDSFPALHGAMKEAMLDALKRTCGGGHLSCRFTHVYPDGPAPYYTFMGVARHGDEVSQWIELKRTASEVLAAHGATITHHHAVGRVHRPWYDRERPEPFALALRAAKTALDPSGILNPGVLIDP